MIGVGVDFGFRAVKVVVLNGDGGEISLVAAGSEPLAAGAVQDGALREVNDVGAALATLLRRLQVRSRLVGLSIGGGSVLVKRFPAPRAGTGAPGPGTDEFRRAVAREAARHVPFHLESLEFDYEGPFGTAAGAEDGGGDRAEGGAIVFGAAPRETIHAHCRAVARAGCEVTRIELEPYALYAAVSLDRALNPGAADGRALAIIELGASRSGVHVFRRAPRGGASGNLGTASDAGDLLVSTRAPAAGAVEADGEGAPRLNALNGGPAGRTDGPEVGAAGAPGDRPPSPGGSGRRDEARFATRVGTAAQEAVREAGIALPLELRLAGGAAQLGSVRERLAALGLGDPLTLDPLARPRLAEPDRRGPGSAFAVAAGLAYQQLLDRAGGAGIRS